LIDQDIFNETIKPEIILCKNNLERTELGILSGTYQIRQQLYLGNINTLTLKAPIFVERNHQLVINKFIEEISNRRLIKFIKGNYIEYYVIHTITKVMDDDGEYKEVQCYSLGIELKDKSIKDYKATSVNAAAVMNDVLSETLWTVDYIDSEFLIKYRQFELSGSVLDCLIQIAETFNGVLVYDTINRKVSMYKIENIGVDTGFTVGYGKLLRHISYEETSSEYCTRLKVFGKNGISINSVNPAGTNYIENFSSILYPFHELPDGTVVNPPRDISVDLARAIIAYQNKLENYTPTFNSLLSQLKSLQEILTSQQNVLDELENELAIIDDNISVANASGQDPSGYIAQKNAKQTEIDNQKATINGIQAQINNVNQQIQNLKNDLSVENNFTQNQLLELNPHIVVQEYVNEYIDDPEELLKAAKEEFVKLQEPKLKVEISIVNLFEVLDEKRNWDKIGLGNVIYIKHEPLGINISAKIIQIDFDYETGDVNLVISNFKEILTDYERFIKNLYNVISSSTQFDNRKYLIDDNILLTSDIYQTINNTWDAAKREIVASNNNTVEISRKGIRVYDLNNPNKQLILQHGIMALTSDGGNTWKTAITPEYIVAETVRGVLGQFVQLRANQIILGDNGEKIPDLVIQSANYWNSVENIAKNYSNSKDTTLRQDLRLNAPLPTSILMDNSGITAYTSDPNKFARLDYRGLYVQNGAIQITSELGTTMITSTGINASAINAGALNGIHLHIGSGNQSFHATNEGIWLGNQVFGNAPFRVDMNGNAVLNSLTANYATINNSGFNNGQIVGSSMTIGSGNSVLKFDPAYGLWAGNANFNSAPFRVGLNGDMVANNGIFTGQINSSSINSSSINGGSISGTSINVNNRFIVDSQGNMTANSANISGNINMTGGTINWNNVNSDPDIAVAQNAANYAQNLAYQIVSGNYTGGTFIDRNNIISPNITGATITGSVLQTNFPNSNRIVIDSGGMKSYNSSNQYHGVVLESNNFSSISFYYLGQYRGELAQVAGTIQLTSTIGSIIIEAGSGSPVSLRGLVDFSYATVTGLNVPARFA